ncbi:putative protein kinase RLK-Pelle-DLSV family [Helianthus anomalus]
MYNISPLSSKTLFFIITSMEIGSMILLFSCVLFFLLSSSTTLDTLSTNQAFKDGDTIVSDDNMFELGFFSPGKSMNRYVGIWYKKISMGTVVWVANSETPITDKSGMLELSREGNLLIRSGMKFGKDLTTGRGRVITPWKSADDPSPGEYLHWLDTNGYPQIFVRQGSVVRWRYGPWNGLKLQGRSIENPSPIYSVQFVFNEKEIYFKYEVKTSVVQRVLVSSMLDWPQRFNIIQGMARGILYLHQDSRLQIIHRDLKAGNILSDGDMNPKISDFGLARSFVGSDTATKTKKVVGTHGYISTEYAIHGRFSEVLRSIHVALLCVQNHAKDRPTMLLVVLMLVSESVLPRPKHPAFYSEETCSELESVSSVDDYMITHLYAR